MDEMVATHGLPPRPFSANLMLESRPH